MSKNKEQITKEILEEFQETFPFAWSVDKDALVTEVSYVTLERLGRFIRETIDTVSESLIESLELAYKRNELPNNVPEGYYWTMAKIHQQISAWKGSEE